MAEETYLEAQEVRQTLTKSLQERIDEYHGKLLALRQRELSKAEKLEKDSPPGKAKEVETIKEKLENKGMSKEKAANIAFGTAWNQENAKKSEDLDKSDIPVAHKGVGNCRNCGHNIVDSKETARQAGQIAVLTPPGFCGTDCLSQWAEKRKAPVAKNDGVGMGVGVGMDAGPLPVAKALDLTVTTVPAPGSGGATKKLSIPKAKRKGGLEKALPRLGGKDQASQQMTMDASKAHKASIPGVGATPKMPSPIQHEKRAEGYADFMPPGNFNKGGSTPHVPSQLPLPSSSQKFTPKTAIPGLGQVKQGASSMPTMKSPSIKTSTKPQP